MNPFGTERKRRFLRDTLSLQSGTALVAVGHVVSSVVLAQVLGAEDQGRWYGAVTLFGFLYLAGSLGFLTTAVGGVARATSADGVREWLGWLTRTWVALAALVLVLGAASVGAAARALFEEPAIARPALLLCVVPLFEVPRTVVRAALEGRRRMLGATLLDAGLELLRVTAVCAAVFVEGTPFAAAAGYTTAAALGAPLSLLVYARSRAAAELPSVREVLSFARRVRVTERLRSGVELGLGRLARGFVSEQAPVFLLMRFADPAWVAYFRIAHRLLALPFLATQAVTRVSVPTFGELVRRGDWGGLARAYRKVTAWTGVVRCAAFAVWLPLLPLVVARFYPEGYAEAIGELVWIFAVGLVAIAFSAGVEAFYVATETLRRSLAVNAALGVGTMVLLFVLSMRWGPQGTAWALALGAVASLAHHAVIARTLARGRDG